MPPSSFHRPPSAEQRRAKRQQPMDELNIKHLTCLAYPVCSERRNKNFRSQNKKRMGDPSTVGVTKKKCQINYKLFPLKCSYFITFAGVGAMTPYIALHMQSRGLTAEEVGVIYGVLPFLTVFTSPMVGAIADRWNIHKQTLMVTLLFAGIFFLLMTFVPARAYPVLVVKSQLYCQTGSSFFRDCGPPFAFSEYEPDRYNRCPLRWRKFTDTVKRIRQERNYSESDMDCTVFCSKTLNSENVTFCFSNGPGDFEKRCSGTTICNRTVKFSLQNLSHVLDSEVLANQKNGVCNSYDVKRIQMGKKKHWRLLCDQTAELDCTTYCKEPPLELCPFQKYDKTFAWLHLIYTVGYLFLSPVFFLTDAISFSLLGQENQHQYGEQRACGSFGFAAGAVTISFVLDGQTEHGSRVNFTPTFYIFTVMCCFSCAIASFLRVSCEVSCGEKSMFHHCLELFTHPRVLVLLLVSMYFGMCNGALNVFLLWYLQHRGARPNVYGCAFLVSSLFETPMMVLSGRFIKRLGTVPCICITLGAMSLRMLGYSLLENPWLVLLIEPLHGLTFALMWAAVTTRASQIAPPGTSATLQAVLAVTHNSVGRGVGTMLTGFLFDSLGQRQTFRLYSLTTAGLLGAYGLLQLLVFKPITPTQVQPAPELDFRQQARRRTLSSMDMNVHFVKVND
ncbi:hypothetical protein BaRGS_00025842 [Batillaria attramentaria]|uniref:Major facilitator superfamily (MFS) profile domain-containing protein n=1 Tax=Batillaria attramentaria TaxID=370345 RepID=A0ABD0K7L6_9CAEN